MDPIQYSQGLNVTLVLAGLVCTLLCLLIGYWGRLTLYHVFAAPLTVLVAPSLPSSGETVILV